MQICLPGSLLGTLLILAAGLPAHAQSPAAPAPTSSAFDGIYVGISAENISSGNTLGGGRARTQGYAGSRNCRDFRAPARLTISNGHATVRWSDRLLEGSVQPNGALTMTTGYGQKFDGRIDEQHLIKGQVVGYCAYVLTWQEQS